MLQRRSTTTSRPVESSAERRGRTAHLASHRRGVPEPLLMPTGLRTATGWHTRSSSMRPRADDPALFKPHQHVYAGVLSRTIRNRRAARRATSLPLCHFVASGIAASRSTSEGIPPVRGSTTARQPRSRARRPSVEQVAQPRSRRQYPSPELLVLGRDITEHAIDVQAPRVRSVSNDRDSQLRSSRASGGGGFGLRLPAPSDPVP